FRTPRRVREGDVWDRVPFEAGSKGGPARPGYGPACARRHALFAVLGCPHRQACGPGSRYGFTDRGRFAGALGAGGDGEVAPPTRPHSLSEAVWASTAAAAQIPTNRCLPGDGRFAAPCGCGPNSLRWPIR